MTDRPLHSDSDPQAEAALLQSMVLLASLATAAEVRHEAAERQAGRDAAAQEPAAQVRPFLRQAAVELTQTAMALQAGIALQTRWETGAAAKAPLARPALLLRRFRYLMTLGRLVRQLHVVHQRILSLYPAVTEALAETARGLEADAAALVAAEAADPAAAGPFVARLLRFSAQLEAAV